MKIGERLKLPFITKFGTFQTAYQEQLPNTPEMMDSRLSLLAVSPILEEKVQRTKEKDLSILFVHGFGGNADQFRKNLPFFANRGYRSFALDLLGYGYGDKPDPRPYDINELYNFYTWSDQIADFINQKIDKPTILVANSVGGIAGLVTAINRPELIKGICLINTSLRLLHLKKQNPLQRMVVPVIQSILRETPAGPYFFQQVATPTALRNILANAYALKAPEELDEEIVELILRPGLDPAAAAVFLDFISYSDGSLPEELIPQVNCPIKIIWGAEDPWEPLILARKTFEHLRNVDSFVALRGGGHCCMDQIPDAVNQEILEFLQRYDSHS